MLPHSAAKPPHFFFCGFFFNSHSALFFPLQSLSSLPPLCNFHHSFAHTRTHTHSGSYAHSLSVLCFLCSPSLSLSCRLTHTLSTSVSPSFPPFLPLLLSPSLLVVSVKLSEKQWWAAVYGLIFSDTHTHTHLREAVIIARWPAVLFRFLAWDEHCVTACVRVFDYHLSITSVCVLNQKDVCVYVCVCVRESVVPTMTDWCSVAVRMAGRGPEHNIIHISWSPSTLSLSVWLHFSKFSLFLFFSERVGSPTPLDSTLLAERTVDSAQPWMTFNKCFLTVNANVVKMIYLCNRFARQWEGSWHINYG